MVISFVELRGTINAFTPMSFISVLIRPFKSQLVNTHYIHLTDTNWDWWPASIFNRHVIWCCVNLCLAVGGVLAEMSQGRLAARPAVPREHHNWLNLQLLSIQENRSTIGCCPLVTITAQMSRLTHKSICSLLVGLNPWRQAAILLWIGWGQLVQTLFLMTDALMSGGDKNSQILHFYVSI